MNSNRKNILIGGGILLVLIVFATAWITFLLVDPTRGSTQGDVVIIDNDFRIDDYRAGCITVTRPYEGQPFVAPYEISGAASAFEGNVVYRLKDAQGKVLAQGNTTAESGMGWAPYRTELTMETPPTTTTGTLEVFTDDARDGSEICKISVPVTFVK